MKPYPDTSFASGFLPGQAPLTHLPKAYEAWDTAARHLPDYLTKGNARKRLEKLPDFAHQQLSTAAELERAMLVLSFLAHAYVCEGGASSGHLAAVIAVPWVAIANRLGRVPIISHASLVLHNWRLLKEDAPLTADNLKALLQFTHQADESWFYMATVEVEFSGRKLPGLLLDLHKYILVEDEPYVAKCLQQLQETIEAMHQSLNRMRIGCRPEVFYHEIRPYLASFRDIHYEGVADPLRSYHGGSAAQSSLLQSIDSALGIMHPEARSRAYLKEMLNYMPPAHAAFIKRLAKGPDVQAFCRRDALLDSAYSACIQAVMSLRNEHLKIVAEYILSQASGPALGTGGTNPVDFLKQLRNDTGKRR